MADAPIPYIKLPGRGVRRGFLALAAGRCSLFRGPDHLLAVERTIATEAYRRFYYRDIEAFIVRQTARRRNANIVLAILALVCGGPFFWAATQNAEPGGWIVAGSSFGGLWLVLAFINTLRGPTCETHVRTAVQLEALPSLGRLRVARRVLGILQPTIDEAQGALDDQAYLDAGWTDPGAKPVGGGVRGPATVPEPERLGGAMHLGLFAALLVGAILAGLFSYLGHPALLGAGTLVMLGGGILCVIALVRQVGSDVPGSVRGVVVAAAAYYLLGFLAAFVFSIVYAIRHEGQSVVTGLEFAGEPGFATAAGIAAGLAAVLGLLGLAFGLPHWGRREGGAAG